MGGLGGGALFAGLRQQVLSEIEALKAAQAQANIPGRYQHVGYAQGLGQWTTTTTTGTTTTVLPWQPGALTPMPSPPGPPGPTAHDIKALNAAKFIWGGSVGRHIHDAICEACSAIINWPGGGWERHRAGCTPALPRTDVDDI